jgi:hypothetical protein
MTLADVEVSGNGIFYSQSATVNFGISSDSEDFPITVFDGLAVQVIVIPNDDAFKRYTISLINGDGITDWKREANGTYNSLGVYVPLVGTYNLNIKRETIGQTTSYKVKVKQRI